MSRQTEAVFEHGVLRPLEPLALEENQHVFVTVSAKPDPLPVTTEKRWYEEQEWLHVHRGEYPGEWVALQGSQLICHGSNGKAVFDEARAKGFDLPLMVHMPTEPELPWAFWV